MRRDWHASYDAFTRAGEDTPLGTDDLDALAVAAWRLGRGKESVRVAERVFTQLARTDPPSAAMKAVELGLAWFTRGDLNIGQGWMNRARRLLDGTPDGPTHGYLAYLDAAVAVMRGCARRSRFGFRRCAISAVRIDTPALTALCHVAEALAAIGEARMTEAFALLDEAMLPVLAGQVPLDWAGDIYCVVLNQCHQLADLPRMHAWTQSMERWCADFAASRHLRRSLRRAPAATTGGHRRLPPTPCAAGRCQPGIGGHQPLGRRRGLLPTRRGTPVAG